MLFLIHNISFYFASSASSPKRKYILLAPTKNEIWMISSYCLVAKIFSSDLSICILKIMYSNRQSVRKKFNVFHNDTT